MAKATNRRYSSRGLLSIVCAGPIYAYIYISHYFSLLCGFNVKNEKKKEKKGKGKKNAIWQFEYTEYMDYCLDARKLTFKARTRTHSHAYTEIHTHRPIDRFSALAHKQKVISTLTFTHRHREWIQVVRVR